MEELTNELTEIVTRYKDKLLSTFTTYLKKYEPSSESQLRDYAIIKDKIIGRALFSLRMHIAEFSSITKRVTNSSPSSSNWEFLLEDINKFSLENHILASHSMAEFWELDFSLGINEIFCGNAHKDGSFGVWTDGKEIYKGEFMNKRKHGYGFQIFNDGSMFEGKFNEGLPVSGKWKLDTGENFFGIVNKEKNFMIGMKEKDHILGKNNLVKNYLYYKGDKTILKNIVPDQEINIPALRGDKTEEFKLTWEDDVTFEGYWDDFNPISGVFTIKNSKFEENKNIEKNEKIRVFGINGSFYPIKSINPEKFDIMRTKDITEIEFLNGATYVGEINREMEISGFGVYTDSRKNVKYCLFASSMINLEFDHTDDFTKKFLENNYFEFFRDSKQFLEANPEFELPMLKIVNTQITSQTSFSRYSYKGHWKDYLYLDDYCDIIVEGKEMRAYCDEGIMLSVTNIKAAEIIGLGIKQGLAGINRKKDALYLDLDYIDGRKYSGHIDVESFITSGVGCLTLQDGTKIQGFWSDNRCLVEFKKIDNDENTDIKVLETGKHTIELKSGQIAEITFDDFKIKEGYLIDGDNKEIFHHFESSQPYYNIDAERHDFTLILVMNSQLEKLSRNENDTIFLNNVGKDEISILKKNGLLTDDEKFSGLAYNVNYSSKSGLRRGSSIGSELLFEDLSALGKKYEIKARGMPILGNLEPANKKGPGGDKDDKVIKISISDEIMYDEREIDPQFVNIHEENIKKLCSLAYFKEPDYTAIKPHEEGIGRGKEVTITEFPEIKELQPKKPYIQITNSGMFKTHVDLFNYIQEEKNKYIQAGFRPPSRPGAPKITEHEFLQENKNIKFALYEMNKLNGIAEIGKDYVKFFNGDEYFFDNGERSFEKSLGTLVKFLSLNFKGDVEKLPPQHFYWKRFFNHSLVNNFEEGFYHKEIKGKVNCKSFREARTTLLKFSEGNELDTFWANYIPLGNSTYKSKEYGEIKRSIYDYGATSRKQGGEATFEILTSSLMGSGESGLDVFSLMMSPLTEKMKLFPKDNPSSYSTKWIKGNNFKHLKMNPKRAFGIKINKKAEQGFLETILGVLKTMTSYGSGRNLNTNLLIEVKYPNGDFFKGLCTKNLSKVGQGVYTFNEGYSYHGNFFANTPFGWGLYKDCLGVVRKGYFFRGYRLDEDYGLEKLKKELSDIYTKNGFLTVNNEDLKILMDPDVVVGSELFPKIPIRYRKMYKDIERTRKVFINDLRNIKDGELDYTHNWEDSAFASITSLILKHKTKQSGNLLNLKGNLQKMSLRIRNISQKREIELKEEIENISKGRESAHAKGVIDFELIEKKKEKNKYAWIQKVNLKKVKHFEKEEIIEMVKDQDFKGIHKLFTRYKKKKLVKKFLNIKDSKKRNILMIAGFYGRRQFFIDMLTSMINAARDNQLKKKDIKKILCQRDYEGNNVVDLLAIQGFDEDNEVIISKKTDPGARNWNESVFGDFTKIEMEQNQRNDVAQNNQIFDSVIEMLKDKEREIFTSNFMTYSKLEKYINSIQPGELTSNLLFLTKRSICLFALFEMIRRIGDVEDLLPQTHYDEKKNNPIHFTLFHGDLHASIQLLRYKFDLLLWRNGERELPPQVIKWSGDNYNQSRAVFASILSEFTRNFNLKVIKELLLAEDGILKIQKSKSVHKFEAEEVKEKERVEKMKEEIKNKNFFNPENVYLYSNNYVLLSSELSKKYVDFIKEKSRYRQIKTDHRIQKRYTYASNSELESLQKNFLDYYQGTFIGYHPFKIEKFYRESVQEILTWYVYVYGDAEINPQIYTLLNIDPFERVLDGRNIFHFMCQNNSYCLLEDFLDYHYEKCHKKPFDPSVDDFKEWDQEIDEDKRTEFREKLMIPTKNNRNTPAHLCAIYENMNCLELLVKYGVDLETINLRGRSVSEILEKGFKEDFLVNKQFTPNDISNQVVDYVKNDILSSCKQHSMKYKYLKEVKNRHEGLKKIFSNSVFSLTKKLSQNRESILKDTEILVKSRFESQKDLLVYGIFILTIVRFNKNTDEKEKESFKKIVAEKLEELLTKKEELKDEKISLGREFLFPGRLTYDQAVLLLRSFVYHFTKGIQISTQNYIKLLFDFRVLQGMKNFKYKKFELMAMKDLLSKLKKTNLIKPLESDIKESLNLDRLLCIEVRNKETDYIQSHPVLVQINNMIKKYTEYSGGFIIDIIRGYPVKVSKPITWYNPVTWFNLCCNKDTEIKWFVLIKISQELLEKVATDDQMKTYNMKYDFHTLFYKDPINPEELEPLRHYQKMKILMKVLNLEFNIENFKKDGIIKSYFPIHDYSKRKFLWKIWSKYKFMTHFFDIFVTKTRDSTLQVFSLIAFYHGIQQGFYFGFFSLYNNSLFLLAFIGIIGSYLQYLYGLDRDFIIFATALVVGAWSALFINAWKRREKELAYSFDTYEEDNIKEERDEYKGEHMVDPGTLRIQKKREINYIRQFFFTTVLFTIGVICTVMVYLLITDLNKSALVESNQYGTIVTGIINGTLNFVISLVYGIAVKVLVSWENHVYEEEMRKSLILKAEIFKIFSQIFTLVVQSIFLVETSKSELTYGNFSTQILSNLITSAILNYGLSVGLPIFMYLNSRYYYISYLLLCKWLCCTKRKGKLDEFRERAVVKILASKVGKVAFLRYCTENDEIPEDMKQKVEDYKKTKAEEDERLRKKELENEKNEKKNDKRGAQYQVLGKLLQHSNTQDLEMKMYKGDEYNIPSPSGFSEKDTVQILKDLVEKVEVSKDYKGNTEILGINRKKNISLRLKEEFAKYVLGREQIIESSYMIDLGTLEVGFYSSLLSQFTFICFFSQFLIGAGLVSYLINLLIIFLIIKIYTRVSRRPISRKVSNIGIWNKLFDIVSYMGIVYNTVIAVKYTNGLRAFTGKSEKDSNEVFETELIYRVQFGLLIFKFLYSIFIPTLPNWIKQRISRENLVLVRNSKKLTKTLNRFRKEFDNFEEMFEDEDSADLKYFFKNEDVIQDFEAPDGVLVKYSDGDFQKRQVLNVLKARKKLL